MKFFRPRRHGNQEEGSISRLESSVESREYISHSASLHSTSVTGGGCPCDPFLVPKLYVDPVLFDNSCFDFFTAFCLCMSILLREWTGDGSWLHNFSPRVPSHGNRIFPAVFRLTLLRVCWSSSCPRVHSSRCFTFFSMRLIFLVIFLWFTARAVQRCRPPVNPGRARSSTEKNNLRRRNDSHLPEESLLNFDRKEARVYNEDLDHIRMRPVRKRFASGTVNGNVMRIVGLLLLAEKQDQSSSIKNGVTFKCRSEHTMAQLSQ